MMAALLLIGPAAAGAGIRALPDDETANPPGHERPAGSGSSGSRLPWLPAVAAPGVVETLHTVSSAADVTVSDGLAYAARTLFHDPQRAVFQRVYDDRTVTQGVEGRYVWQHDGDAETEAPASVEPVILGHQVHARILFFDRFHRPDGGPRPARFAGRPCLALVGTRGDETWTAYYEPGGLLLGLELASPAAAVTFTLAEWRPADGIELPHDVTIDDGERQFEYRYRSVRLNQGKLADFRLPEPLLTDEQVLMRRHRAIMDAHLFEDAAPIRAIQGDPLIIVSGGDVVEMSRDRSDAMIDRIMATRDHHRYDDLIRPVIRVSEDGALGWVIARVAAGGVRLDADGRPGDPLEFVAAWVELYEKIDGSWRMTGNVSNFHVDRD